MAGVKCIRVRIQKGRDYVFVVNQYISQRNIAQILEGHIPSTVQLTERPCRNKLYQIVCYYYLSPCGSQELQTSPSSVCPEDCSAIEEECSLDWSVLEQRLRDFSFIQCEDTKSLLFPFPSCCTSVSLELVETSSSPDESPLPTSEESSAGIIAAVSVVALLLIVSVALGCALAFYIFNKWKSRTKAKIFQSDIFSRYVTLPIPFHIVNLGKESNQYCGCMHIGLHPSFIMYLFHCS